VGRQIMQTTLVQHCTDGLGMMHPFQGSAIQHTYYAAMKKTCGDASGCK